MVYGVLCDRANESAIKRRFTKWFYSVLSRTASISIVPNAGDFRLFDRRVVDALRSLPERTRFMKGLYCWVGFKSIGVPYRPAPRHAGKSQFNFWRLFKLAVTGLTSFTDIPLRIWSAIGFTVAALSTVYGVYITVRTLIFGIDVPGWATLTIAVTFLGGVQIFSIGVLGEYIGRIFSEVKQRPVYLVGRYFNLAPQKQSPHRDRIRV
jgi:glycosyltransferase involved in cell wall biosynthesis